MKSIRTLFVSFLLAMLFAGGALANDGAFEKVNVNTADAATLAKVLVNVGMTKAEAIVEHRREHGPFESAEQLANVKGIGLRTVEMNIDRIVVGDAGARGGQGAASSTQRRTPQRR